VLTAAVVLAAGCADSDRQVSRVASGVALEPMPAGALRECRSSSLLRPACPSAVPAAPYDPRSEIYGAHLSQQFPSPDAHTFSLQWGGETLGDPERNRPPRMVHLVLVGGLWRDHFRIGERVEAQRGVMRTNREKALDFGRVVWSGRAGRLLLAPAYPRGGIQGNHLLFRWREGSTDYQLSLHAWEPFPEAVATLRAILATVPGA
jgi:hypothetical protein